MNDVCYKEPKILLDLNNNNYYVTLPRLFNELNCENLRKYCINMFFSLLKEFTMFHYKEFPT